MSWDRGLLTPPADHLICLLSYFFIALNSGSAASGDETAPMVLDNDEEQLVSTAAIERSMGERLINEYQQQGYSSSGYDDDLDYGDRYDDHHSMASLFSMADGDIAASIGPISDHDADFDYDSESGPGAERSSDEEGNDDDDNVAEEKY